MPRAVQGQPTHHSIPTTTMSITIQKYKSTRNWSVELNGELLAVTVYKKGALSIAAIIRGLAARCAPLPLSILSLETITNTNTTNESRNQR